MKHYNRALDCITLAMAYAAKGQVTASARMFTKAMAQPDVKRGIEVLEFSNKQAYAKVEAAAKKRVAASKKVTAGDDIDMGDEEDLSALIGDDVEDDTEEDMGEAEEAAVDEDMEEADDFDGAEFAKVLAGMQKRK